MTKMVYNFHKRRRGFMTNKSKQIGDNIHVLRENAGYTQTTLARFLNVDQSLVSKIEKGERNISTEMLEKLASLFGVTVDEIEDGQVSKLSLSYAFRGKDLNAKEMEAICVINKIALNSELMSVLLKRADV